MNKKNKAMKNTNEKLSNVIERLKEREQSFEDLKQVAGGGWGYPQTANHML